MLFKKCPICVKQYISYFENIFSSINIIFFFLEISFRKCVNVQVSRLKYFYFFFTSKINYIATNKLLGNIKCMVSFMNYKLNLGDGKKTWHRTRLAQISLIHVFQGSYHAFCFFFYIISQCMPQPDYFRHISLHICSCHHETMA